VAWLTRRRGVSGGGVMAASREGIAISSWHLNILAAYGVKPANNNISSES